MDFIEGLPKSVGKEGLGKEVIFVVVDSFSKFLLLMWLKLT